MKTTIVIPNYNGAHFLEKCMPALLSQSRQDFSILFVDNASKDDSESKSGIGWSRIRSGFS